MCSPVSDLWADGCCHFGAPCLKLLRFFGLSTVHSINDSLDAVAYIHQVRFTDTDNLIAMSKCSQYLMATKRNKKHNSDDLM